MKLEGPPQSGVKKTSIMHTAFHKCMTMNIMAVCRRDVIIPNKVVLSVLLLKFGTCAAKLYVRTPIVTWFFVIILHSSKQIPG